MTEREQAAEKYAEDIFKADQKNVIHWTDRISAFLDGCEHADKEHREFYLNVRELFQLYDLRYKPNQDPYEHAKHKEEAIIKIIKLEHRIEKALTAFTEREINQLPFKAEIEAVELTPEEIKAALHGAKHAKFNRLRNITTPDNGDK